MKEEKKKFYESPDVCILELVLESAVLTASGDIEDMEPAFGSWN